MSKHKLTDDQKAQRAERRAARRQDKASRVSAIHDWLEERRVERQKSAARKRRQRTATQRPALKRLPKQIRTAPSRTVETVTQAPRGTYKMPDGRTITANYADRRAKGQRGHHGKPRRRELHAVAIERLRQTNPDGLKMLQVEALKAQKAGKPMTRRELTRRAYELANR